LCGDIAGAEGVGIIVGRYGKEGHSGGLIDMAADVRVAGEKPTIALWSGAFIFMRGLETKVVGSAHHRHNRLWTDTCAVATKMAGLTSQHGVALAGKSVANLQPNLDNQLNFTLADVLTWTGLQLDEAVDSESNSQYLNDSSRLMVLRQKSEYGSAPPTARISGMC
jgi:hypothetical protein